ncbi:hypothetical protein ACIBCO_02445 [Streptomyces violascens]
MIADAVAADEFPDASIEHWSTTDFGRAAARPSPAAPESPG